MVGKKCRKIDEFDTFSTNSTGEIVELLSRIEIVSVFRALSEWNSIGMILASVSVSATWLTVTLSGDFNVKLFFS